VLLALTEPYVPRGLRLRVAGSVAVGLLLTLLWPYYPALGMVVGGTVERVKDADPEELGALHRFYAPRELLDILGFCLISLLALPYLWVRRLDVFAVLGSLLMLGVFALSALVPIPLGHRYVLLSVFFLQIALVRVLLELTPAVGARRWASRGLWRWPVAALVGVLLVSAAAWNVWVAREHFMRTAESGHFRPGSDSVTVRYARRVSEIAGRRAVVLSTALASWPLPTFGPKIVAPHHSNPLIVDTAERRRAAILFFAPHASPAERRAIVARYGVTHVVLPPRAPGAVGDYLERLAKRQVLPGGYSIFALSP
jgi:hypothetical protein